LDSQYGYILKGQPKIAGPFFLIALIASMLLLGLSNLYLGVLEVKRGNTCMYTYMPSDPCFSPDFCVALPSNFSCAPYYHPYFVCSTGELAKAFFGLIGAVCMTLVGLALVEQTFHVLILKRQLFGERLARTAFLVGLGFGVVNVGFSIFGTIVPTTVDIGDCRSKLSWQDTCGLCVSVNSTSSKDGYLRAWWDSDVTSKWLTLAALA
jgi:hypothetical protein